MENNIQGFNNIDIVEKLGITGLDESDKASLNLALGERVQEVILRTIIAELEPSQLEEFNKAIQDAGDDMEEKIFEITASTPGLKESIEEAVENELGSIKLLYDSKISS